MRKEIAITAAVFAILFVFGCTNPLQKKQQAPAEYNVTVTPRVIVPGGVSTIKFTINNNYEATMKGTMISIENVPGGFTATGGGKVGDIPPGQSRPQVITIKAPQGLKLSEVLSPKVTVCYNYTTDFYSDFLFESVANPPTTSIPIHSGYTKGPVSVTLGNNVGYPSNTNKDTITSLTINNIGNGKIKQIYNVSVSITTSTKGGYEINGLDLTFYTCKGSGTNSVSISNCDDFKNSVVIGDQAMGTLDIKTSGNVSAETQYDIQTLRGKVYFEYCYDVNVGSITVKPVGVR